MRTGDDVLTAVDADSARSARFGPLDICFDDRVLAPRPWTVAQSNWAAELAGSAPVGPMLELCAGAGQIGLLAALLTGRLLVQVEADPWAARYARRNADHAGLAERVDVRVGRIQDTLRSGETFAVVIADPPYLPTGEVGRFPADPIAAIDGGADGLNVLRSCLDVIGECLAPLGSAIVQVAGARQADELGQLIDDRRDALREVERRVVDDARALVLLRAS